MPQAAGQFDALLLWVAGWLHEMVCVLEAGSFTSQNMAGATRGVLHACMSLTAAHSLGRAGFWKRSTGLAWPVCRCEGSDGAPTLVVLVSPPLTRALHFAPRELNGRLHGRRRPQVLLCLAPEGWDTSS